jgi:hypothetical protein
MGEGEAVMTTPGNGTQRNGHTVDDSPRQLEREVEAIRSELGDTIGELDRRRHELFDVRLQVRRHWKAIALICGAASAAIAAAIVLKAGGKHRRREQHGSLRWKADRLRQAVRRMIDDPEAVAARAPSVGKKVVAAAASALAATFARKGAERVFKRAA